MLEICDIGWPKNGGESIIERQREERGKWMYDWCEFDTRRVRQREKEIYTSFFSLCLCFGSSPLIITLIIIITIIIISLSPFFRALSPVPLSHPSLWRSPCQSDRNVTLWLIIPGLHRLLQVASLLRHTHKKKTKIFSSTCKCSFYLSLLFAFHVCSIHTQNCMGSCIV